ncbi:MAG: DUF126 domain-containing protein [Candidatus Aenigmarchaeota archaeon]|nr:DUF126 domain-containing protein [Candidatus Aenigmarchaeota archaeon]RLI97371.1 MAG: hypothetical protein DRO96_00815 [Candidatus Aenigmarchaeota archaeon]
MIIKGRVVSKGVAEGEALVSRHAISFLGDVDPKTGNIINRGSDVFGQCIADKIFIFPNGRGSTVGSYVIYQLKKNGTAPKAILNIESEPIVAVGAIISGIPLMDKLEKNPLEIIKTGQKVKVNAEHGFIEL